MGQSSFNREVNQFLKSLNRKAHGVQNLRGFAVALCAPLLLGMGLSGDAADAATPAAPTAGPAAAVSRPAAKYGQIPLSFEPNQGQTDGRVQFLSHGSGYSLFLTPGEVVLSLERPNAASTDDQKPTAPLSDTLRMNLVGSNAAAAVSGVDPQPGVVSYLIGNDRKKWHSGIHTFGKVNYAQIYPGVDLVFYGNQRQLEYDFVVAPGADASKIVWKIDGAAATVDASGDLQLHAANGPASFKKPVIYQMDGDKKIRVDGAFEVAGNQVRFKVGDYDRSKKLIIDPVLSYASYLAGNSLDNIGMNTGFGASGINNITQAAAVDSNGSLYVTGYTYSTNFPVSENAYQATPPARTSSRYPWAFVTKVSPDGSSLAYSTYLGGSIWDYSSGIAVDTKGDAYVTGYTASPDFPITAGAYDPFCGSSWNSPPSGIQEISGCPGLQSAFVTELNPEGTGLVYSTFLDGYGDSEGVAIAVDSAGRAYVTGNETDGCASYQPAFACFPTTSGAIISGAQAGNPSQFPIFISVFDPTGSTLLYSTLFGDLNGINHDPAGSGPTYATAITVDSENNFYVTANVDGLAVPTTHGVIQPEPNGINTTYNVSDSVRGFIVKFTPVTSTGGPTEAYGTYLGGGQSLADSTSGIAVDAEGNAYVTGLTQSYDFPVTQGAYQTTCGLGGGNQCGSAYVVKLNSTASQIEWGTFIGDLNSAAFPGYQGPVNEVGPVQLDANGNVYITGQSSLGFPLVNPVEPVTGGNAEAFVAEFDPTGSKLLFSSLIGTGGAADSEQYSAGMGVNSEGDIYLAGNTNIGLITTPGSFEPNDGNVNFYHGFVAKISHFDPSATGLAVSPATASCGQSVTLTATVTGTGVASTPTGTVTFYNGNVELGAEPLNNAGVAALMTTSIGASTTTLTASYGGDTTFAGSNSTAQSLSVSSTGCQTITFPAPASPVTYGVAPITLSASASSGLPVSFSVVSGPGKISGNTLTITGAGPVQVVAKQSGNGTYPPATPVTNTVVVNQALLTVGPHPPLPGTTKFSVGYGDYAPFSFDLYVITGFVNGDNASVLSGAPTATPVWGTQPGLGTYPLTIGVGTLSAANYTFTAVSGTITVVPGTLTIKPYAPNIKYGSPLPALGYVATGLAYGQSAASVMSAAPVLKTAATAQSGVGVYSVSANVSGITAANYVVVAGPNGTMTINPETLVARTVNIVVKFGAPIPALTYKVTGYVNGDTGSVLSGTATLTTTATQGSPRAVYPITFSTEGLSASNYVMAYTNATVTIE